MIELPIYLEPHDGKEGELESLYRKEYVPGISIQEGFQRTALLKKCDALRQAKMYPEAVLTQLKSHERLMDSLSKRGKRRPIIACQQGAKPAGSMDAEITEERG